MWPMFDRRFFDDSACHRAQVRNKCNIWIAKRFMHDCTNIRFFSDFILRTRIPIHSRAIFENFISIFYNSKSVFDDDRCVEHMSRIATDFFKDWFALFFHHRINQLPFEKGCLFRRDLSRRYHTNRKISIYTHWTDFFQHNQTIWDFTRRRMPFRRVEKAR